MTANLMKAFLGGTSPLIPTPSALDSVLTAKHRYAGSVKRPFCAMASSSSVTGGVVYRWTGCLVAGSLKLYWVTTRRTPLKILHHSTTLRPACEPFVKNLSSNSRQRFCSTLVSQAGFVTRAANDLPLLPTALVAPTAEVQKDHMSLDFIGMHLASRILMNPSFDLLVWVHLCRSSHPLLGRNGDVAVDWISKPLNRELHLTCLCQSSIVFSFSPRPGTVHKKWSWWDIAELMSPLRFLPLKSWSGPSLQSSIEALTSSLGELRPLKKLFVNLEIAYFASCHTRLGDSNTTPFHIHSCFYCASTAPGLAEWIRLHWWIGVMRMGV